jgi:hypothetical protein
MSKGRSQKKRAAMALQVVGCMEKTYYLPAPK